MLSGSEDMNVMLENYVTNELEKNSKARDSKKDLLSDLPHEGIDFKMKEFVSMMHSKHEGCRPCDSIKNEPTIFKQYARFQREIEH